MTSCNLVIDSCCDLPPEVVNDKEGLYLLSFPYILNGGTFDDDLFQHMKASDFYDAMKKGAEPTTSQVPITVYQNLYQKLYDTGKPSVYIAFTSGLSGSFDVAQMVRDQFIQEHPDAEIYLVDSHLASIAQGLLSYEAIQQWERGLTAEELAQWAEEARFFVNEEFMVDDLHTLRRGGRISTTVAVAGTALDVKPLLSIDIDGKLAIRGVSRGRKKGIRSLADYYSKKASSTDTMQTVTLGHANCPKDVQRLKDDILHINPNAMVVTCNVGPVIGSHVGPGMIAVSFWGKDKREDLSVTDRIARKVKGGS